MAETTYCCIKKAIENSILKEPFNIDDFRKACKDEVADGTFNTFLNKHKLGNDNKETEMFVKNENNKTYTLIIPYLYDCKDIKS